MLSLVQNKYDARWLLLCITKTKLSEKYHFNKFVKLAGDLFVVVSHKLVYKESFQLPCNIYYLFFNKVNDLQ